MQTPKPRRNWTRWQRLLCVTSVLALALHARADDWRLALPGWKYEFPRDHAAHPEFKTEWWYFTGHVVAKDGRRFGYQLTFFRQGIRPTDKRAGTQSRFIVDDLKFAHFAISDVSDQQFRFEQKLSRGAFGEAGFSIEDKLAWIDDWQVRAAGEGTFALHASGRETSIDLELASTKPWVFHGVNGISQKAEGEGRASHYYSGTRLKTAGKLMSGERSFEVIGESWLDREWATNQLAAGQLGWNWFSLQLSDQSELMIYQMRTRDGGLDPNSSATFVTPDGSSQHLTRDELKLTPVEFWTSKATGGRYPIGWNVEVPKLDLRLKVTTPMQSQELVLKPIAYWEGLVDAAGSRGGIAVRGQGYMELTGYAGALVGLSQ